VADRPTRLCIISRDSVGGGDLTAAVRASLRPDERLEIILDRRHGKSAGQFDLKEDRRRQREVDVELEAKGFAIVPASVDLTGDGTSSSLLFPKCRSTNSLQSINSLRRTTRSRSSRQPVASGAGRQARRSRSSSEY
jgi:hypothetical protein